MITFKDFAGNARKKKKKQAGTQKKVNKVKKFGIREGRQVFEYIGKVIKPAVDARDDTLTVELCEIGLYRQGRQAKVGVRI